MAIQMEKYAILTVQPKTDRSRCARRMQGGVIMKQTLIRAIVSIAVFAAIYLLSGPIIGWTGYDMYLRGIEFLAVVIGAGCYWIGSRPNA